MRPRGHRVCGPGEGGGQEGSCWAPSCPPTTRQGARSTLAEAAQRVKNSPRASGSGRGRGTPGPAGSGRAQVAAAFQGQLVRRQQGGPHIRRRTRTPRPLGKGRAGSPSPGGEVPPRCPRGLPSAVFSAPSVEGPWRPRGNPGQGPPGRGAAESLGGLYDLLLKCHIHTEKCTYFEVCG